MQRTRSQLPWQAETAFAALALAAKSDAPKGAMAFLQEVSRWVRPRLVRETRPYPQDWEVVLSRRIDAKPWLPASDREWTRDQAGRILEGAHLLADGTMLDLGERFLFHVSQETGQNIQGLRPRIRPDPKTQIHRLVLRCSAELVTQLGAHYARQSEHRGYDSEDALSETLFSQIALGVRLLTMTLDQREWRVAHCDECVRYFPRYGKHNINRPHTFCSPRCRVAFNRSPIP